MLSLPKHCRTIGHLLSCCQNSFFVLYFNLQMIRKLTLCSINVNIVHFVRGKRGIQNANTANDYGSYRQKSGPDF